MFHFNNYVFSKYTARTGENRFVQLVGIDLKVHNNNIYYDI